MTSATGPAALLIVVALVLGFGMSMATTASQHGATDGASAVDWSDPRPVLVTDDVDGPSNFMFAPDGSIWFAEVYSGNVSVYDPGTDNTRLVRQVEIVQGFDERGLVGLALAPDFADTGAYYLYYTSPGGDNGTNRLVRIQDDQETLLTTVPAAPEHNGGRILVAPDDTLYVSTGENQLRDPAQDPTSLLGKILHMTADGGPVDGNIEGLVYSLGHRNVYGLAWDPERDELWATENSGWRRDEINRIEAGGNYGYPECEGHGLNGIDTPCPTDKGYIFPAMSFYEDRTAAPTGATFWNGDLYWGSLKEGSIHRMSRVADDTWNDTIVYEADGPVLDVRVGPDDDLYFATFTGIWQFDHNPDVLPEGADRILDNDAPTTGPTSKIPAAGVPLVLSTLTAALLLAGPRRRP